MPCNYRCPITLGRPFLAATAQPINLIGTADDKLRGLGTILTMKNQSGSHGLNGLHRQFQRWWYLISQALPLEAFELRKCAIELILRRGLIAKPGFG